MREQSEYITPINLPAPEYQYLAQFNSHQVTLLRLLLGADPFAPSYIMRVLRTDGGEMMVVRMIGAVVNHFVNCQDEITEQAWERFGNLLAIVSQDEYSKDTKAGMLLLQTASEA